MKLIEEYLKQNYSPRSIQEIQRNIQHFCKAVYHHKTGQLPQILNYIEHLRKQNKHPKSIKISLQSIKIYYRYLQQTGQRKDHPCQFLHLKDKLDSSIKTEQLYTQEQLTDYLEQTLEHKKLMVSLLIHQGLTTLELVQLAPQDLDLQKAELNLKNRKLKLKATQIVLVIKYLESIKSNQKYLFENKNNQPLRSKWINTYINYKQKIRLSPKKIRQSVIMHLLKQYDLRVVQVFSGHKKSSTTLKYRTTDLEELKLEIQNKHPLNYF